VAPDAQALLSHFHVLIPIAGMTFQGLSFRIGWCKVHIRCDEVGFESPQGDPGPRPLPIRKKSPDSPQRLPGCSKIAFDEQNTGV
jgi:hypothetical protein